MIKPELNLDLDGVLVDFVRGSFAAHGKSVPIKGLHWDYWTQMGITEEEFWAPMGHDFWANLPWTKEGKKFLAYMELVFGAENIVLLTSPADTPGAVEGKVAWIRRELPDYKRRYSVSAAPKAKTSCEARILVDDNKDNVQKYRLSGGPAVMIPRPWNPRIAETDDEGHFDVEAVAYEVDRVYRSLLTPTGELLPESKLMYGAKKELIRE